MALVTGGSSGIGRRCAKLLAASGAAVMVGARRVGLLDTLRDEIAAAGGLCAMVELDVVNEASVVAAFDAAAAALGPVDTVVANAGVGVGGSAMGIAADDLERIVAVNVRGTFLTAREGARRMVAAGASVRADAPPNGRIVLVSSVTGAWVPHGNAAYAATKAAVNQMGRAMARDWASKGINVNILAPGYMRTDLNEDLWDRPAGRALLERFPRGRLMTPSALDPMLLYLCSAASEEVTGSVFSIDDGQTL